MLIVIDVQEKYMSWYDSGFVGLINRRIEKAVRDGERVVYVCNTGNESEDQSYSAANGLRMVENAAVFQKRRPSAFSNEEFERTLKECGERELELIGADGNCCVARTATDAIKRGYTVRIDTTYVGAKNKELFEQTIVELKKEGCYVCTT